MIDGQRETKASLERRWVLTGFVFDEQKSEQVEDWGAALERLDHGQLLWLAMHEPTEEEVAALKERLELDDTNAQRLREPPRSASVADEGERMHVTLYAVNGDGDAPALIPVECVLGPNWIITAYRQKIEVLDEFFERAQGEGKSARSTHPRSSQRFSTGSSPAISAPWMLSRANWRSWTRRS